MSKRLTALSIAVAGTVACAGPSAVQPEPVQADSTAVQPAAPGPDRSNAVKSEPAGPASSTGPLQLDPAKLVDLTHPMHPEMAFWPGGVPFAMTRLVDYDKGYRLHKFEMGENTGTHMDAPSHFVPGKRSIEAIPLSDLFVHAAVIDVRDRVAKNPNYQLTVADVVAWEAVHGKIAAGSLVILNTGWHARYGDPAKYINMDESKTMHFPGFARESAELLVQRDVAGIGIDTLSLDYGPSKDFITHQVMLRANKYQIENMANLDILPPTGALVIIGVLPVKDGSQAQARIFAILP
ncbi:MAG: cyclase family protein [Proteobacteria bacterium]|nr:cyclase family protein [Pseudomonadota bacterium]